MTLVPSVAPRRLGTTDVVAHLRRTIQRDRVGDGGDQHRRQRADTRRPSERVSDDDGATESECDREGSDERHSRHADDDDDDDEVHIVHMDRM